MLFCCRKAFWINVNIPRNDQRRDSGRKQLFKRGQALFRAELSNIGGFCFANDLKPVRVEKIKIACHLQRRTVDVVLCNLYFFKIFGGIYDFQAEFLHQAAQLHAKFL